MIMDGNVSLDRTRVEAALGGLVDELLAERHAGGPWTGRLSSSALSTATAAFALTLVDRSAADENGSRGESHHQDLIQGGLRWLAENANPDGGWGDTVRSQSNLSTTALCWAALGADDAARSQYKTTLDNAEAWIAQRVGSLDPSEIAAAVAEVYGEDRTFSVPILTMCALAGKLGEGAGPWKLMPHLPFEFGAFPPAFYRHLGLPVVSYALPALIAIGQAQHHLGPSRNPFARGLRNLARSATLRRLDSIQPSNGGFLEATPLTAFVTMSLVAAGQRSHPVVSRGVQFLACSVYPDGSWPIDTNLSTWVTTLSINALAQSGSCLQRLSSKDRSDLLDGLLDQQFHDVHPYTQAPPGGWSWTALPGSVPDADDTAGALIALKNLGATEAAIEERTHHAAEAGLRWLLGLQNRDGGIPTFCRGWGKLPFDRSGADLTAHALKAFCAWRGDVAPDLGARLDAAALRGAEYLRRSQRPDGAWLPLWFGNEHAPRFENPTLGTARVLMALRDVRAAGKGEVATMQSKGVAWILGSQNENGGWGGAEAVQSSIEETALALDALADRTLADGANESEKIAGALARGANWLCAQIEKGRHGTAEPIGFYFANLWYFEKLYPLAFSVSALARLASNAE